MLLLAACRIGSADIVATPPLPAATATPIVIVATPTPLSDADLLPIDIEEQLITNLYERVGPSVVHMASEIVTMDFFFDYIMPCIILVAILKAIMLPGAIVNKLSKSNSRH